MALTPGKEPFVADLSGKWIDSVHGCRPPRGILPDVDSSASPTHGEQEHSVWNGHYDCTCYHPLLFVFDQYGDLERCALRPGNVHSAYGWEAVRAHALWACHLTTFPVSADRAAHRVCGVGRRQSRSRWPAAAAATETVLHKFKGGSDGANPRAGLISDSTGALYGTTLAGGGTFGPGVVFKLKPPAAGQAQWTEKVLYRFTGVGGDGDGPQAGLVFDSKGALYGTTSAGGGPFELRHGVQAQAAGGWAYAMDREVLSDLPNGGGANPLGDPLLCPVKGGQPDCGLQARLAGNRRPFPFPCRRRRMRLSPCLKRVAAVLILV